MDKLNLYLQTLLSTCSYELHLESGKPPYLISSTGTTEVENAAVLASQISTWVFPLIPPNVKRDLPNKSEIEFNHTHKCGNFNFLVKKTSSGFNVTVRPLMTEENEEAELTAQIDLQKDFSNGSALSEVEFEEFEDIEIEDDSLPTIETVPIYDPELTATFSETATYQPPLRPQEFMTAYPNKAQPGNTSANNTPPSKSFAPPQNLNQNQISHQQKPVNSIPQQLPVQSQIPSPTQNSVSSNANPQAKSLMNSLFKKMAEIGASDLHLSVSVPPMIRKDGKMMLLEEGKTLTAESMKTILTSIMPEKNIEEFDRRNDTDFAYEIPGLARFRANIFKDRKGMGGVFRIIPTEILTAEKLGLSKSIMDLCNLSKGLVVVTGPTGSGKSTTLCAMVDSINKTREDHIITIEDPIEFTHENQKCLVNQREVHNHTDSFKDALRAALREDPDILLVGEMRDLETISIAIETAETGHLVFGTLHTTTAPSTVDRIIDQFPADRQQQIRVMLSESLKGVIAQTLLPKKGGGRVAALEVLIVTPAISNLIREGKTFQIPSAMQTGKNHGMVMLNDALLELVKKGLVEPRDAYIKAIDKTGFEGLLNRNGMKM